MSTDNQFIKRETFKEQAYFDEQVQYNDETLAEFNEIIVNINTSLEHRRRLRYSVFRGRLEQLITKYSRGEPTNSLVFGFSLIVESLTAYHLEPGHSPYDFSEFDDYIHALWLVSIAILLDVDKGIFDKLIREISNLGRDRLYDRLVGLYVSYDFTNTDDLMYPKPYQFLFDALDAKGDPQTQLIVQFLKNYYKGMKKAYWHDSHLGEDAGFFGYWCFELAAFVKKLQIDDHAFVDNIFYPVDLVKYEPEED